MGEVVAILLVQYGGWGLLLILLVLILTNLEKVEKVVAEVLDLFSWAGASWRRRAVKADIQSNINLFGRSIDKEVRGLMPYNMELKFVTEMDRAELLQKQNMVIVRIRDRRHDDKNLVHAMLTFCPVGLLPEARPYLDSSLSSAVDYTMTRKLLSAVRRQSALSYLYKEVMQPQIAENPDLDKLCRILDRLDEQGLLTRVVLRELREMGVKVGGRYPTEAHREETKRLIEYMDAVAKRAPQEEIDTQFQGNYISMGFVFIGMGEKVLQHGLAPYINAIRWKKEAGIGNAYIAARDHFIDTAESVAYLAEKRGLAKMLKPKRYYATDTQGNRREHILIEMQLIPSAPFAPPEQLSFLED